MDALKPPVHSSPISTPHSRKSWILEVLPFKVFLLHRQNIWQSQPWLSVEVTSFISSFYLGRTSFCWN